MSKTASTDTKERETSGFAPHKKTGSHCGARLEPRGYSCGQSTVSRWRLNAAMMVTGVLEVLPLNMIKFSYLVI